MPAVRRRCRDMLTDAAKDLRVGNLMVLLHIGSMPHDLTLKNIDMFSSEVIAPYPRYVGQPVGRITGGRKSCGPSARPQLRPCKDTRGKTDGRSPRTNRQCVEKIRLTPKSTLPGSGPAVVFLHGAYGLTWDPLSGRAGRAVHRVRPGASGYDPGRPGRRKGPG